MGSIIQLFVSLLTMTFWLLMQVVQMTVGLLSMAVRMGARSSRSRRAGRGPSRPRGGKTPSGTGRFVLFAFVLLIAFATDARIGLALLAVGFVVWLVRRRSSRPRTATAQELSELFANVRAMSGQQFEAFAAELFSAMGYHATVLGGSGDQGVDVLLQATDGQIAVQ